MNTSNVAGQVINPPINSEVQITGFSVMFGFSDLTDVNKETFENKIFIADARKTPDGAYMQNELFLLKDALYPHLPDASQLPNGIIHFFAYQSQMAGILNLLNSNQKLWLKTKDGRVSILSANKALPV